MQTNRLGLIMLITTLGVFTNSKSAPDAREYVLPVRSIERTILNPDGTVNGYKCLICDPKAWCFVVKCGSIKPY
ncbi:hypothetical protein [Roseivirga sp.]|uniref:hypothetical protein n=1 Tax=Roseivirga sp. TaxID=1964215 RepID=UPI003B52CC9B